MGLDMYLNKKNYVGNNYRDDKDRVKLTKSKRAKELGIKNDRITYIEENIGYWRKANAIHKWFVDNVQEGEDDCRDYYVSQEQLKELLGVCQEVLMKAVIKTISVEFSEYEDGRIVKKKEKQRVIVNADVIAKILPTEEGFFFGCTDYNEYYLRDIEDTIKIIENAIKEPNISSFYYKSSW